MSVTSGQLVDKASQDSLKTGSDGVYVTSGIFHTLKALQMEFSIRRA